MTEAKKPHEFCQNCSEYNRLDCGGSWDGPPDCYRHRQPKPVAACPLCKVGTLSVVHETRTEKVAYADDTFEVKMKSGEHGPQVCGSSKHTIHCNNCGNIDNTLYTIEPTNHLGAGIIHWRFLFDDQKKALELMMGKEYNYMFKDAGEICEYLKELKLGVSEVDHKIIIWPPMFMDDDIRVVIAKSDTGCPWGSILAALAYFYTGIMVDPIVPQRNETLIDTIPALESLEIKHVGAKAEQLLKEFLQK